MKRFVTIVTSCLLLASCGGASVQVGMREAPIDVTYGTQGGATPAARPPGAGLGGSTFPGFIAPPVLLDPPVKSSPSPKPQPVECPTADPFAVPKREAGSAAYGTPKQGRYTFRRDGYVKTARTDDPRGAGALADAPQQPMPTIAMREVRNAHRIDVNNTEYDVVQQDGALKTTTTYHVDNTSGMYITRIVTERSDLPASQAGGQAGVESFNPQPMIKIANFPLSPEGVNGNPTTPQQTSGGVDPLTGIAMQTYFRTVDHLRVDACGTVLDAWMIHTSGQFQRPNVRSFNFSGDFAIAPQLGALIIFDEMSLSGGRDDAAKVFFEQYSKSTVNAKDPS